MSTTATIDWGIFEQVITNLLTVKTDPARIVYSGQFMPPTDMDTLAAGVCRCHFLGARATTEKFNESDANPIVAQGQMVFIIEPKEGYEESNPFTAGRAISLLERDLANSAQDDGSRVLQGPLTGGFTHRMRLLKSSWDGVAASIEEAMTPQRSVEVTIDFSIERFDGGAAIRDF